MSRSLRAAIGASTLALAAMPGVALAKGGDSSSQPRGTNTPATVIQRSGRRHPQRNQKRIQRHQRRPAIQAGHRRAHLLVPGTGYHQAAGSTRVRSLQRRLAHLGFTPGPVDGRYGPLTTRSVQRFQAAAGLAVDGIAGPHTLAALNATRHAVMAPGAGYHQPAGSAPVRSLQRRLVHLGFTPGPIDGRYGPLTTSAVNRFQHDRHLPVSPVVGRRTLLALRLTPDRRSRQPAPATSPPRHPTPTQPTATKRVQPQPTPPVGPVLLALALALLGLAALVLSYYTRRRQVRYPRGAPPQGRTGTSRATASAPAMARIPRTQQPAMAGNRRPQQLAMAGSHVPQQPALARNHLPQQQTTALDQLVDLSWLALADESLPEVGANVSADRVTGGAAGPEEPADEPGRIPRAAGHPVGEDLVAQEGHVPGEHGGEGVAVSAAGLSVTSPRPEADDDVHFGVAARALGVSRKTVERMVKRGELERGPSNALATVSKRALVSTLEARRRHVSHLTRATEIERSKSADESPAAAPAATAAAMTELSLILAPLLDEFVAAQTHTAALENELERRRARRGHDRALDELLLALATTGWRGRRKIRQAVLRQLREKEVAEQVGARPPA